MKKHSYPITSLLQSKIITLLTKFSVFFLSERGFGMLAVIENSVYRAKTRYYRQNLKNCGEGIRLQFPITITHPESVVLGHKVSLAAYVHIWGKGGIKIGNKVMIGAHTSISSLTHDYKAGDMYSSLVARPVVIEDNVWIGSNCVIMPGVSIGKGAVVGAGAVVTNDVAADSIVFGVPARPVKFRK